MSEPFLHLGEAGAGIYGNRGRCGAGDMGSMSWEGSRAGTECLFYGIRDFMASATPERDFTTRTSVHR